MSDHSVFHTHQAAMRVILGLVGRYRLTIDGPEVEVSHSDIDPGLPACAVRVRAGGEELLMHSAEWVGRTGDLEARVLAWLLEHVDLRGAKLRKARRADPVWWEAWRGANPGRVL